MTYTVKSVMPTGKEHATYGTEFYVQFEEDAQAYPLWFKKAPEAGAEVDGEVVDGKFKKIKKEYKPDAKPAPSRSSKPAYKDNSDGMRQGMCINNAANYVNGLEFKKAALTDVEWAETVHSYATALYRLGDLKALETAENGSDDVSNVQDVFKDAKPVNG